MADSSDLTLGIVGAGTMGAGIAQLAATSGVQVRLFDAMQGVAPKAIDGIATRLARSVEKKALSEADAARAVQNISAATSLQDLAGSDIVLEAVVEDLEIKRRIFRDLEEILGETSVLASNTSSLAIASIAQACRHRSRVAGMHFFNPVHAMQLVEVIAAPETAPAVSDRLVALAQRLGRTPVRVIDAPGFLVNFGGRAFTTEALHILHEGVAGAADIDAVMRDCCGFRMGPFELMDLIGIDVNYPVTKIIHEGYWYEPRLSSVPEHGALVQAGRLGRKTGAGFYSYDDKGQKILSPADPETGIPPARIVLPGGEEMLTTLATTAGIPVAGEDDGASPIVIAPLGEDCTTAALRLGIDPRRAVAIDVTADTSRRITIMTAPGADPTIADAASAWLRGTGRGVTRIKDSPGFIGQRITAMVANLGCEMAQIGLASPADIDTAIRLGLNYPTGPLAMADKLGVSTTYGILCRLQEITGSDRYRPSLWLRRRALLGLPAATV
ncbi:MAG: 3-hydroxyacyl-CoA dehydrogenase [Rhodospirillales bacterium]|nr:3-hydroxyacyl-CoA dehydrogenase [Rhodospirillales bacterium]